MNKQIIKSFLDTDLYKITQQQAVYHQYPLAQVFYEFKCRNVGINLGFLAEELKEQIMSWSDLRITPQEASDLRKVGFFAEDFIRFLENDFKLNPSEISVINNNGELEVTINGKWIDTIWYEVPILATVNELYFNHQNKSDNHLLEAEEILRNKLHLIKDLPNFKYAEFGTRRRFSGYWQEQALQTQLEMVPNNIVGVSNVKLAFDYGLKPIGTVAHEWTMAHLGLVDNIGQAQKRALHVWQQEFGSSLGIALTDTFTTDAFFRDFDFTLARGYDGVRHDSGDPFIFGEKCIKHWESIGIDPKRKTIVFSDGLDFPLAIKIWKHFVGRTGVSFGIGTNITNDFREMKALAIVMKLLECNGTPCIKLSDVSGKNMGNLNMIDKVKLAYNVV